MTEQEQRDNEALIKKFRNCDHLMTLLFDELGLDPKDTTFPQFQNRFSEIVSKANDVMKKEREQFVIPNAEPIKKRKPRVSKERMEEQEKEEIEW